MQFHRRISVLIVASLSLLALSASLHVFPGQAARIHALVIMVVTCSGTVLHLYSAIRSRGHARRVWSLAAVGFGSWAYGEVSVGFPTVVSGVAANRGLVADLLDMVAFACTVAAMMSIPAAPSSAAGRVRMLLDGLIAASALFGVAWVFVLAPMLEMDRTTNAVIDLSDPVLAVGVLAIGVVLLAGSRRPRAGAMIAITGGVLLVCVSLLVDLAAKATGQPGLMLWALDGYIAAAGVLAIAPHFTLPQRQDREWRPGSTAFALLPYLPMGGYLLVCLVPVFAGRDVARPVLVAGMVLVAAMMTRQFLTIRRNIVLSRDLAEQQARSAYEAAHDSLTGLPNRAQLNVALGRTTGEAMLLMVDLDGFKAVNDTLGHPAGDQLLVTIAGRLRDAVAGYDALGARLGGDEFAVLLHTGGLAAARELAGTLIDRCAEPVLLDGPVATVRASIGIASGTDGARLLRDADLALYEAKHRGKGRYQIFDRDLSAAAEAQQRLKAELGAALTRAEFTLRYEPLVDLRSGATIGVEQVLRWQHPHRGLLDPEEFLPAAAEAGLLAEIDRWMLETAVADLARWRTTDPDFQISLQLSPRYLASGTTVDDLRRVLTKHRQPAAAVTIRVPDGDHLGPLAMVLADVRLLGVRVLLDCFGVGPSAVVHLRDLEVDAVKLHPAYLRELGTSPEWAAMLTAVIAYVEGVGLSCVAGGVEHPADAGHLRSVGCRTAQGPLFGGPLTAEAVAQRGQIRYATAVS